MIQSSSCGHNLLPAISSQQLPKSLHSIDTKGIFHHECFYSLSETIYTLSLHNTQGKEFHKSIRCGMKQYFFLFEFAAWSLLCMSPSSSIVRTAVFIYLFYAIWDLKQFSQMLPFIVVFFHKEDSSLLVQSLQVSYSSITIIPYSITVTDLV